MEITVNQILNDITEEIKYVGEKNVVISDYAPLNRPKSNAIMWCSTVSSESIKIGDNLKNCIIVTPKLFKTNIENVGFIITNKPKVTYFNIMDRYWYTKKIAIISDKSEVMTSKIGKNVTIGANCYIGEDVVLGDNTVIEPNVVMINKIQVGSNCLIKSGAKIGSDGFGYFYEENVPHKVNHYGGIVIGNCVDIGNDVVINRGTLGDTIIGDNTKIDSHVIIGHNAIVNENVLVVGDAIIGGSAKIGKDTYISNGVIVKNGVAVGERCFIPIRAVVTENIEDEASVTTTVSKPMRKGTAKVFMRMNGYK